ncbi:hypothetical protein ANCCAN_11229 [Ancylostoma caninum]|uniref:Zinc knuckle n=1 Tax=Ancylostoma caninum TaxID=29170 RepID=A0A368GEI1_ANCCA|nr:hypothetical protein ANCCAN_11229 [Ancylostoma caninum]
MPVHAEDREDAPQEEEKDVHAYTENREDAPQEEEKDGAMQVEEQEDAAKREESEEELGKIRERDDAREEEQSDDATPRENIGGLNAEEEVAIHENAEYMDMVEEMEEEDEEEVRRIAQNAARRAEIIRELDQSRQALQNFEDIIQELDWLPRCEPRNFQGGTIYRDDERTLRCAFCERVGDHYSDSCTVFRNVEERKRLLQSRRRCVACLDVVFTSHICRKRNAPCYHCKARGHNSAICDLPEKSEEIRRQLHNALNGRKDTEEKILALQRELRDLH